MEAHQMTYSSSQPYLYSNNSNIYDINTKRPVYTRAISKFTAKRRKKTPRNKLTSNTVRNRTTIAIKDPQQLEAIKQELLYAYPKTGIRNYMIFCVGINLGLRAGDLLTLRLKDIWNEETKTLNTTTFLKEEKTEKTRPIYFLDALHQSVTEYILSLPNRTPDTPLFPSNKKKPKTSKKHNERIKDDNGCLDTNSYGRILREISRKLGMEHICTHTMRKTYGYNVYTTCKNKLINGEYSALDMLQHQFSHSSSAITLRYINITNEAEEALAYMIQL